MIIPRDLITVKFHEGRPFLKIFYQFTNVSSDYFHENDDFEYINEKNKFSIIKYINLQFKYNGYYEFLLEYPSVLGYNRWKQRLFPTETDDPSSIGYLSDSCSCSWTGRHWGGLFKSSRPQYTYLEGSALDDRYWYSIGAKMRYDKDYYFAGPVLPGENAVIVQQVLLYVFMPPQVYKQLFMLTNTIKTNINIRILLFIMIL